MTRDVKALGGSRVDAGASGVPQMTLIVRERNEGCQGKHDTNATLRKITREKLRTKIFGRPVTIALAQLPDHQP